MNHGGFGKGLAAGLILLVSAGCGDLFEVENPGSLTVDDLTSPELLSNLINTAEGNLAGTYSSLTIRNALLSDELFHATTQAENVDLMRGNRLSQISVIEGAYDGLAQVRWLADEMALRVSEMVSNPQSHVGMAKQYFWGGIARITLADHFNVIVYSSEGQPRGPLSVLRDAIEKLEQAAQIAGAAGEMNLEAGALGASARAYRSLYFEERQLRGNEDPSLFSKAEQFARQALDAKPDFNVSLVYGAPGPSNGLSALGGPFGGSNRIDEVYLFLPDPVTGNWDPRVPHEETIYQEILGTTAFNLKYTSRSSAIAVSRAAEAKLIIAEARLVAGDLQEAVDWINEVRADARASTSSSDWGDPLRGWPPTGHALSDLRDFASSDTDEIYAQLRHERKAELWLEMRSWQDQRYYEIFPYRWFSSNKDMGHSLRFRPSVAEIAGNDNLDLNMAAVVYVDR